MRDVLLSQIKDRFTIWEQSVWTGWSRFVVLLTTLFTIFGIVQSQINGMEFFQWDWWAWALLGLVAIFLITLEGSYRLIRTYRPLNWIDKHILIYNKPPILPEYLQDLAPKYIKGTPITKNIEIINMSMQFYNRLLPSRQKELQQLIEWSGSSWEDYYETSRRMAPPGPQPPRRIARL